MARAYKNANGEIQVEVPVRTGTDTKGGVLLGLDHLSLPELTDDVAAPSSTRGRLYVKDASGRTKVFLRDSTGVVRLLDENDGASGAAGGDLSGTYPNPSIAAGAVGTSKLADNAVTQAKASIGSGSTQLAGGDDSRFPTAGQKNALAGTDGTPGSGNEYLTKSGIGSRVQAWDADLDAVAALATLAFGRGLLELANAAAVRTYIGLGTSATKDSGAAGSAGKVLNADDPAIPVSPPAPPIDRQVFTADGTWTKPTAPAGCAAYSIVEVEMIGGGGGGGAGRKGAASTNRRGGGGGGGGSYSRVMLRAADCGGTEAVTVGQGGAGASGQTANSNDGASGADGTSSRFGAGALCLTAAGGGGAGGQSNAGGGGGSNALPVARGVSGGGGASGANLTGTSNIGPGTYAVLGGAGGGGVDNTNTEGAGGLGGAGFSPYGGGAAGSAGTAGGGNGGNATDGANIANLPQTGGSGGGGGGSKTGNAGSGGNGGKYGGGGGGGGGALDSVGNSGAGGNGGQGVVIVTTR